MYNESVPPLDTMLRIDQVCRLLGRSRSSVLRDVRAGRLPRPLKTGPRTIGWLKSEIIQIRNTFGRTRAHGQQS